MTLFRTLWLARTVRPHLCSPWTTTNAPRNSFHTSLTHPSSHDQFRSVSRAGPRGGGTDVHARQMSNDFADRRQGVVQGRRWRSNNSYRENNDDDDGWNNSGSGSGSINESLRNLRSVRLIDEGGKNCGVMSGEAALARARKVGLDLMRVSGESVPSPPVLKIVDYSSLQASRKKKMYEKNKADKESRKLQRREGALKQIRLSPKTDNHDIEIKLRRARQMLMDGYRVKVYMMFRRGHGGLVDSAKQSLIKAAEELSKCGKVQGVVPGMEIKDLFYGKKKRRGGRGGEEGMNSGQGYESEEEEEEEEEEDKTKKKPLEVHIYPLPRKERFQLLEKNEQA